MKKISYQVQGSAKEPYNITIALDGTNISCICDCPAGSKGSHCKHWMLVFEGGKQKYIGLDENQIAEIQSWLPGSNLDEPWQEFNKIKDQEKQLGRHRSLRLHILRCVCRCVPSKETVWQGQCVGCPKVIGDSLTGPVCGVQLTYDCTSLSTALHATFSGLTTPFGLALDASAGVCVLSSCSHVLVLSPLTP